MIVVVVVVVVVVVGAGGGNAGIKEPLCFCTFSEICSPA